MVRAVVESQPELVKNAIEQVPATGDQEPYFKVAFRNVPDDGSSTGGAPPLACVWCPAPKCCSWAEDWSGHVAVCMSCLSCTPSLVSLSQPPCPAACLLCAWVSTGTTMRKQCQCLKACCACLNPHFGTCTIRIWPAIVCMRCFQHGCNRCACHGCPCPPANCQRLHAGKLDWVSVNASFPVAPDGRTVAGCFGPIWPAVHEKGLAKYLQYLGLDQIKAGHDANDVVLTYASIIAAPKNTSLERMIAIMFGDALKPEVRQAALEAAKPDWERLAQAPSEPTADA